MKACKDNADGPIEFFKKYGIILILAILFQALVLIFSVRMEYPDIVFAIIDVAMLDVTVFVWVGFIKYIINRYKI